MILGWFKTLKSLSFSSLLTVGVFFIVHGRIQAIGHYRCFAAVIAEKLASIAGEDSVVESVNRVSRDNSAPE